MVAAAILPGVVIGAALGLLGGGGSVLTVPIFVYVLGYTPKEAIAMSLAVVAVTSAFGAASHSRARTVDVPVAVVFGGVAMAGTWLGVQLARFLPGTTQLLIFALVMLAAAVFMIRGRPSAAGRGTSMGAGGAAGGTLKVAPVALAVGTLTGIVGVGGGFLIVPALVFMRMSLSEAVGTSLLVITGTCVVGFLGYVGEVQMNWPAIGFVAAGTLPGILVGTYIHGFLPQAILRRGFAVFLLLMAAFILIENVI